MFLCATGITNIDLVKGVTSVNNEMITETFLLKKFI